MRENKTKVVTAIGNYLNNLEDFEKADSELTNPCVRVTHTQYASRCHHRDSTPLCIIISCFCENIVLEDKIQSRSCLLYTNKCNDRPH